MEATQKPVVKSKKVKKAVEKTADVIPTLVLEHLQKTSNRMIELNSEIGELERKFLEDTKHLYSERDELRRKLNTLTK